MSKIKDVLQAYTENKSFCNTCERNGRECFVECIIRNMLPKIVNKRLEQAKKSILTSIKDNGFEAHISSSETNTDAEIRIQLENPCNTEIIAVASIQ